MQIFIILIITILYLYFEQLFKNKLNIKNTNIIIVNYIFLLSMTLIIEYYLITYYFSNSFISIIFIHFIFFRNLLKFLSLKIYFYFFSKINFLLNNNLREFICIQLVKIEYFLFGSIGHKYKKFFYLYYLLIYFIYIFNIKLFVIFYIILNAFIFFIYKLDYCYDGLIYNKYCNTDVIITPQGERKKYLYINFLFDDKIKLEKLYFDYDIIDLDFY